MTVADNEQQAGILGSARQEQPFASWCRKSNNFQYPLVDDLHRDDEFERRLALSSCPSATAFAFRHSTLWRGHRHVVGARKVRSSIRKLAVIPDECSAQPHRK
jgi:hypothetical protein